MFRRTIAACWAAAVSRTFAAHRGTSGKLPAEDRSSTAQLLLLLPMRTLGVEDSPNAKPLTVTAGAVLFDRVTFQYGRHLTPLFRDFSIDIRPGERVGLAGHSGSGKTTLVKLLHRLYNINEGRRPDRWPDIKRVTQTSLRAQLALVSQEPCPVSPLTCRKHRVCPPGRDPWRDRRGGLPCKRS